MAGEWRETTLGEFVIVCSEATICPAADRRATAWCRSWVPQVQNGMSTIQHWLEGRQVSIIGPKRGWVDG